jgi:hypothetical protein
MNILRMEVRLIFNVNYVISPWLSKRTIVYSLSLYILNASNRMEAGIGRHRLRVITRSGK